MNTGENPPFISLVLALLGNFCFISFLALSYRSCQLGEFIWFVMKLIPDSLIPSWYVSQTCPGVTGI